MNQIIKAEVQYKLQDIDSLNRQADDTLQFDVVAPMFEGKGLFFFKSDQAQCRRHPR